MPRFRPVLLLHIAIVMLSASTLVFAQPNPHRKPLRKPHPTLTPKTLFDLTIDNGPHAGHFETSTATITCTCNANNANSFGNQYSLDGVDTGLTSIQLLADDKDLAMKGTTKFYAYVRFGSAATGDEYIIDTRDQANSGIQVPPTGSGRLLLTQDSGNYVATVSGKTSGGIRFTLRITCLKFQTRIDGRLIEE